MRSLVHHHTVNTSPLKVLVACCVWAVGSATAYADEAWVSTHTRAFASAFGKLPTSTTPVAKDMPVHITVALKLRNEADLNKKLDGGTPHHFLTPAQFAEQYSPTEQQANQVSDYLKNRAFTISASRLIAY